MAAASCAQSEKKASATISWSRCLRQRAEFYESSEAIRIADNVLLYQRNTGGWKKGIDMARILSQDDKTRLRKAKSRKDSTLDNGATHTQMRYLARVYNATGLKRFRQAFLKAIDYLLEAQYANGGWPQTYPSLRGYSKYITFNDGAMIGAMSVLRDIASLLRFGRSSPGARSGLAARPHRRGVPLPSSALRRAGSCCRG